MRDSIDNIDVKPLFNPAAATTDNTAFVSNIIDMQGYDRAAFIIQTGSLADADATFTTLIEDGNASNLSDHAEVAANFLNGTEALASFTFAADNKAFKIGYIGGNRYVRVTITPAANTGNAFIAGVAILSGKNIRPTANPPT